MNTNMSWSEFMTLFNSWPVGLRVVVVILAVYQLGMEIAALIDVIRRKKELVNGNKILWVLIIVMFNLLGIGAIIYFMAGRKKPAPMFEADERQDTEDRAQRAADVLYGDDEPRNVSGDGER